mgnify:CR=1 FL=1
MSVKLKCLIVDDEPIARQIVEKYCSYITDIDVAGPVLDEGLESFVGYHPIDEGSIAFEGREISQMNMLPLHQPYLTCPMSNLSTSATISSPSRRR